MFQSSRARAPASVAWIPPPRAGRRHRGTHTWMTSFSVEHTFNIVNVSMTVFSLASSCVGAVYYKQIRKSDQRPPLRLRTADLVPQPRTPWHQKGKSQSLAKT